MGQPYYDGVGDFSRSVYTKRYNTIMRGPVEKLSPFPFFKFWGYSVKTLMENMSCGVAHKSSFLNNFKPLVFGIGTNSNTSIHTGPIHSHDYIEAFYIVKGGLKHVFNGREFTQKEGSLLVIPPFFSHTIEWLTKDTVFIQLDFSERLINQHIDKGVSDSFVKTEFISPVLLNCVTESPLIRLSVTEKQYVESILYDLLEEYNLGTVYSFTYIRLRIIELMSFLTEKIMHKTKTDRTSNIVRALRYIMDNSVNGATRQEVADYAHLSPSSLFHLLKKTTGINFSQLTNYLRVHYAQRLLLKTDKPLTYICHKSGFCDSAYFNNTFKKYTSMTPNTYREIFKPEN